MHFRSWYNLYTGRPRTRLNPLQRLFLSRRLLIKATCEKYEQKIFFQKNKMSIDNGDTMGLLLQILKGGTENQKKRAPKALQCDACF